MGSQNVNLGVDLTVPTAGTRGWASSLLELAWKKVSSHDHTGSGKGVQIGTLALADLGVTTGKLANLAVTAAKLAADAVETAKIVNLAVTTAKLADSAVTAVKIASEAVTSGKLAKNLAGTQALTVTQAGNAATLDFNNGNIQQLSLVGATGAVTVTLSNPQTGGVYKIWITQAAAVTDITWPASVLWPQGKKYGQDPVDSTWVPQNPGDLDCVTLYYNGTNYLGDWQLKWS